MNPGIAASSDCVFCVYFYFYLTYLSTGEGAKPVIAFRRSSRITHPYVSGIQTVAFTIT